MGVFSSYMAGHEDARVMTGHIGTNTPKFVPPRWGRQRFDLLKRGCANSGVFEARWYGEGSEDAVFPRTRSKKSVRIVQYY